MFHWLHDSGIATWVTAGIVFWYTYETRRMRRELMVQNTRAVLPFINAVFPANQEFAVRNISLSPALNVSVDPLTIEPNFHLELRFPVSPILTQGDGEFAMHPTALVGGKPKDDAPWTKNFYPHVSLRQWQLTIRFQTIEGKHYKQTVTIPPRTQNRPIKVSPVQPDNTPRLKLIWDWLCSDPFGR